MLRQYRNIYQTARECAGLTQETAAERIEISVESLRAYEQDKRFPPDRIVLAMTGVYQSPMLAYRHMRASSEIGQLCLPAFEPVSLAQAILKLQKEINDFVTKRDRLIAIGCDGVIDEAEMPEFLNILKEVDDIVAASLMLKNCADGGNYGSE